MKIVFMGTPDFAAVVLNKLVHSGHEIPLVITQPDKAKNRGKKIQFTPVKEIAAANNIEVMQPEKIKNSPETLERLRQINPDIIVVVAYGQIIQKDILQLPKYGCINVHASLLPKLRGASPIQHAILLGEKYTGVTIMQMGEGLDTGDMLTKAETPVAKKNGEQLHDELAQLGADLLVDTLTEIEAGTVIPEPQNDELSTYAGLITKKDGQIDFRKAPEEIERQVRAFDPWPGAYCSLGDKVIKIWEAEALDKVCTEECGICVNVSSDGIDISCGGKILRIKQLQMPGKKRVEVKAFLLGNKIEIGSVFQ